MDIAGHASRVACAPAQTALASIGPKHVGRNPPVLGAPPSAACTLSQPSTQQQQQQRQRTSVSPNLSVLVTNSSGVMGSPYSCCTAPACNNKRERGHSAMSGHLVAGRTLLHRAHLQVLKGASAHRCIAVPSNGMCAHTQRPCTEQECRKRSLCKQCACLQRQRNGVVASSLQPRRQLGLVVTLLLHFVPEATDGWWHVQMA